MSYTEFPASVLERLGYYVYSLADPADSKIFYIGKGTGNRVFAHASEALATPTENDKLNRIRAIHTRGDQVQTEIIRHGLSEKEALEVESALIDFVGLTDLTNRVEGHDAARRGRMTAAEITAMYQAPAITIVEPAILIIVNRLFERNIPAERLYEITRGNWAVGERRQKAKYAFAIYRGIVREIYAIASWEPAQARAVTQKRQSRWRFEGTVALNLQHYLGGSVEAYVTPGARNPVSYVNC